MQAICQGIHNASVRRRDVSIPRRTVHIQKQKTDVKETGVARISVMRAFEISSEKP